MVDLTFGFTFRFLRDKSVDKLVKEHEAELTKLKAEKEEPPKDAGKTR
jgi:hypothetical protein